MLSLLNSNKVQYLVLGGYAVGYHGYPRPTGDIDIWIATSEENAKKVKAAVAAFGFDVPNLTEILFLQEGNIVRFGLPPLRIEILTSVSGITFQECYSRRVIDIIDGVEVSFISLEDLKTNKLASGRHKDLNDYENLP
jgi:hypothetical protein